MEKDAIRNQKVFVSLASVVEFQKRYSNTLVELEKQKEANRDSVYYNTLIERKRTIEQLVELLGLPISR